LYSLFKPLSLRRTRCSSKPWQKREREKREKRAREVREVSVFEVVFDVVLIQY
jgi:hypothetical protein